MVSLKEMMISEVVYAKSVTYSFASNNIKIQTETYTLGVLNLFAFDVHNLNLFAFDVHNDWLTILHQLIVSAFIQGKYGEYKDLP